MIITLTGPHGSGKSTVGILLARKLGYTYFSIGDARGAFAIKLGLTIDELTECAKTDSSLHTQFDNYLKELGKTKEKLVVEAWLGWFFIQKSFKVFLDVSPEEGAHRVFGAKQKKKRPDEREYTDVSDAKKTIAKRTKEWRQQVINLYGKQADFLNKKNYDLCVQTDGKTPQQVLKEILDKLPTKPNKSIINAC